MKYKKYVVATFINVIIISVLFFWIAQTTRWIEGWMFIIILAWMTLSITLLLYKTNPELLKKRFSIRHQDGQSKWDTFLLFLISKSFLATIFLPAYQLRMYALRPFPFIIVFFGFILLIYSCILIYVVFTQNKFLIPVVKKQKNQKVISSGLYATVRHPMYASFSLYMFAAAIALSSSYALLSALFAIFLLMIRCVHEEYVLSRKLKGYKAYMKKVRWRMLPYVF